MSFIPFDTHVLTPEVPFLKIYMFNNIIYTAIPTNFISCLGIIIQTNTRQSTNVGSPSVYDDAGATLKCIFLILGMLLYVGYMYMYISVK